MMVQAAKTRSTEEPEKKSSGRSIDPIRSLVRHWKLAAAVALTVIVLGVPFAWIKGKAKWRSEGSMFVSPRFLRNLDGDSENELQSNQQYREFVQQQVRTVDRYDILKEVLTPGTPAAKYWFLRNESMEHAVNRLRGALQVTPVPDTYLVTVALEGDGPDGMANVVNSVLRTFIETSRRETLYDSVDRLKNLAAEKQRLTGAITKLSDERSDIANQLGTTVFNESMINSLESQLGASQSALAEARRNRFAAEATLGAKRGSQEPSAGTLALALQEALGDASLNSFKNALTGRKAQLMVGMSGLSPQHPERIAAEKEIKAIDRELEAVTLATRDRLAKNIQTIDEAKLRQSTEIEDQIQRETEALHQQIENYSRGYQRSVDIGDEIDRLRKRVEAVEDRENFLELESKAPGFVRIFSPALTPDEPYEGGRKKLLMIVFAASLLLGLAVPVGIDFMDPRMKAARELESHLGLPITGWLPESALVDPAYLVRAAVSIRRHAKQLRHRVLVVTAISHGGGSTTVSLGLGLALDRLGTRTIVVEANPLTSDVRYQGKGGLEGLISWMSKPTGERLPVTLGSGELPDRVATGAGTIEDLLPVERLLPLFEREADAWDLILIDAGPLESSLATEELIRVFGSVLLVVNSQIDKKKDVTRCMEKIDQLAPEAFGAVLNKVAEPGPLFKNGKANDDVSSVLAP